MTEQGVPLPQEALDRIERQRREALEAELQSLEETIASEIGGHEAGRRQAREAEARERGKTAALAAETRLAEILTAGEVFLGRLDTELERRRAARREDERRRREDRISRERAGAVAHAAAASPSPSAAQTPPPAPPLPPEKPVEADPALKVKSVLRAARNHMERGDMALAAKVVAEGLEIDAFNAELVDLDGKIREAMAADTFSASPPHPPAQKTKERKKAKKAAAEPPAPGAAAPPATAAPATGADAQARRFPTWAFTAIAATLLVAAAVILYTEYFPSRAAQGMIVAVLPWKAEGDPAALEPFSHGLPEVIATTLASGPGKYAVLGYATSANLASIDRDPVSSLITLGYGHFLTGSIARRDARFAVRVELNDSAGSTLWAADYLRDSSGLLLVPYEVAHGLRGYLGGRGPDEAMNLQVRNPAAHFLYLRGLAARRAPGGRGAEAAVESFRRSLAFDPDFAPSHAGLAQALLDAAGTVPSAEAAAEAEGAARTAVTLAPGSADGHLALARALIERGMVAEAGPALDSARTRAPGLSGVPFLRALGLLRSGQLDRALEEARAAYRLDPRNPGILGLLATLHQLRKSFDRALWYRETAMHFSGDTLRYAAGPLSDVIILDPMLALNQGRRVTSACLAILERNPADFETLYSLARMLQVTGDLEESRQYFDGLEASLRNVLRELPGDTRARMYLGLAFTRQGKYADGIAIGEAALASDTATVEGRYLLARIHALQMYSPATRSVDSARQARALGLLRDAVDRKFLDEQICSADLYNIYTQADIRSVFDRPAAVKP